MAGESTWRGTEALLASVLVTAFCGGDFRRFGWYSPNASDPMNTSWPEWKNVECNGCVSVLVHLSTFNRTQLCHSGALWVYHV